jgi:hypothetical protein
MFINLIQYHFVKNLHEGWIQKLLRKLFSTWYKNVIDLLNLLRQVWKNLKLPQFKIPNIKLDQYLSKTDLIRIIIFIIIIIYCLENKMYIFHTLNNWMYIFGGVRWYTSITFIKRQQNVRIIITHFVKIHKRYLHKIKNNKKNSGNK